MSGIVFATYSATTSSGSTGFTPGATYKPLTGDFVAAGAFTGVAGLPTTVDSLADFRAYVDALASKTTEVSTDNTQLQFVGMTHQYFGIGGAGDDTLLASSSTSATGTLIGGDGDDTINGGSGNDVLSGGDGDDFVLGGDGNDTMDAGLAAGDTVTVYGGTGTNTLSFAAQSSGVTFDLNLATQTVHGATLFVGGVQNLVGTAFDDVLTGDANDNTINGGGNGDDTLHGGDGTDTLSFAGSNAVRVDLSYMGGGYDNGVGVGHADGFENILGSSGDDSLIGSAGDNRIDGNGGFDYMDGLGGINTVAYSHADRGVEVSLALQGTDQNTRVGVQVLINFTNLLGSNFGDELSGNTSDNLVDGGAGADTVDGGGGNDTLVGGGDDGDTVSYASSTGSAGVQVSLALQYQPQTTGVGDQLLVGFTDLVGSTFADKLIGDSNANDISSGGGKDTMYGGGGDDVLRNLDAGGVMFGQAGDDHLVSAGHGAYLDGGAGADTYDFRDLVGSNRPAAVLGEIDSGDTVSVEAVATDYGLAQFTAVNKFTGHEGQVLANYHADNDRTVYKFDFDGDGRTDARLVAKGGDYDFSQFTGVDTSHLNSAPHGGDLVV